MAEIVTYGKERITLGTCQSLYNITIGKFITALESGKIKPDSLYPPSNYLEIKYGFRFRFPFPDEDHLPFGKFNEGFERHLPVTISASLYDKIIEPTAEDKAYSIGIEMQKQIERASDGKLILAVVVRDLATKESYRIEEDEHIRLLIGEMIKNHIWCEQNKDQKRFYRKVAARILQGYKTDNPAIIINNKKKAAEILKQGVPDCAKPKMKKRYGI
jgi:hypothetical protein